MADAQVPRIFDEAARCRARDRAAPEFSRYGFLRAAMLEGIDDRLSAIRRAFTHVLEIGCFDGAWAPPPGCAITRCDAGARFAAMAGGVQVEEAALPFAPASFDLAVSAGVLDSVNDLPGALRLIARSLRPDGLFIGAMIGAGSLNTLRRALREAEGERPVARIHPQIDLRSAGDLLTRAGFALPVVAVETVTVRYASLFALMADLRGMAGGNVMASRLPLRRDVLARAAQAFADSADPDGRTAEYFEIIYMTGWAPADSQPKPARRGSATASLAAALRPPTGSSTE